VENLKKLLDASLKLAQEIYKNYQLKECELVVAKIEQAQKWFEELQKKI